MGTWSRKQLVSDFLLSFMWVWSSIVVKIIVSRILVNGGGDAYGEIVKTGFSIANMFLFSFLCSFLGGAYNPLTVLSSGISGNFDNFLYTVGARIPAQVVGSITGVRYILRTFPGIGTGPILKVDIHHGALTEGLLTFAIVFISLGLSVKIPSGFFMKTWITSVSKVSLHILGSDLTGGCMNPAAVMGWAFARGDHLTRNHIIVYWLAPIEGTLVAVWLFRLLVQPSKKDSSVDKKKSQ
ncbi:hypothetical protein Leryth_004435 [Lithospermum erythrorhizon]|uniref:Aquaporin SIP2-1 n=1 Tax=Lithospermum erythrorhizon TaxID=34254 RepID=A0AAV3Q9C4_LITER|nr:hypothetical protein Leryth_004435 [Lithospermum erythrorhizon]